MASIIEQERLADIIYEIKRIEPRISDGFDKHVEYPEDLIKVLSEFFLLILQEDLELCEKIQAIIIIMIDFERYLSDSYALHVGKHGVYNTLKDFAIRIMIP
jgi:hypothetical protein